MIRSALHGVFAVASTLVLIVAIFFVTISVALAVVAYWITKDPRYSNCWAWAANRAFVLLLAWWRDGRPKGWEPRTQQRWSRKEPWWFPHFLVGLPISRDSDELILESFKPTLPDDADGWRIILHMLFLGSVQRGDGYHSVPPT